MRSEDGLKALIKRKMQNEKCKTKTQNSKPLNFKLWFFVLRSHFFALPPSSPPPTPNSHHTSHFSPLIILLIQCFLTTSLFPSYALASSYAEVLSPSASADGSPKPLFVQTLEGRGRPLEKNLPSLTAKKTFSQAQGLDVLRQRAAKDGGIRDELKKDLSPRGKLSERVKTLVIDQQRIGIVPDISKTMELKTFPDSPLLSQYNPHRKERLILLRRGTDPLEEKNRPKGQGVFAWQNYEIGAQIAPIVPGHLTIWTKQPEAQAFSHDHAEDFVDLLQELDGFVVIYNHPNAGPSNLLRRHFQAFPKTIIFPNHKKETEGSGIVLPILTAPVDPEALVDREGARVSQLSDYLLPAFVVEGRREGVLRELNHVIDALLIEELTFNLLGEGKGQGMSRVIVVPRTKGTYEGKGIAAFEVAGFFVWEKREDFDGYDAAQLEKILKAVTPTKDAEALRQATRIIREDSYASDGGSKKTQASPFTQDLRVHYDGTSRDLLNLIWEGKFDDLLLQQLNPRPLPERHLDKSTYTQEEAEAITGVGKQGLRHWRKSKWPWAKGTKRVGGEWVYRKEGLERYLNSRTVAEMAEVFGLKNFMFLYNRLKDPNVQKEWEAVKIGGSWYIPVRTLNRLLLQEARSIPLIQAYRSVRKQGYGIRPNTFYELIGDVRGFVALKRARELFGDRNELHSPLLRTKEGKRLSGIQINLFARLASEIKRQHHIFKAGIGTHALGNRTGYSPPQIAKLARQGFLKGEQIRLFEPHGWYFTEEEAERAQLVLNRVLVDEFFGPGFISDVSGTDARPSLTMKFMSGETITFSFPEAKDRFTLVEGDWKALKKLIYTHRALIRTGSRIHFSRLVERSGLPAKTVAHSLHAVNRALVRSGQLPLEIKGFPNATSSKDGGLRFSPEFSRILLKQRQELLQDAVHAKFRQDFTIAPAPIQIYEPAVLKGSI